MPVMITTLAASVAQVLSTPAPMPPGTLPPLHIGSAEMTCPVGGQRFTAATTNMWSVTGRRPDEKPYSEVPFPRPLPECPNNGLVLFADFTLAEISELAEWIGTPVYRSMRKSESQFYRAYWLATKIHRPEADAIEQLLPAIWEAKESDGKDPRRPQTTRYQRVLVSAAGNIGPAVSLDDRIWLRGQAANALREMGKFDEAEKVRKSTEAELPRTTRPALGVQLKKLKAVILRHDRSDEPLDMIPDVQAALLCRKPLTRNAFDQAYCARPSISSIFKATNTSMPYDATRRNRRDKAAPGHRHTRAKGSLVGLFTSDDYPNEALRRNETGTVHVLLTIDTSGRASDCQVKLSSMSPSLDVTTCRVLSERATFEPARDRAGRAVTDSYSQRITWKIPAADAQPVGGIDFRIVVAEHVDGRPDCRVSPKNTAVTDAAFCENARDQARTGLARISRSVSIPYRATMSFQTMLGDQVPSVNDPASTVRSAARLRIDEDGHVTGCQPIVEASLNGDDGTDLCRRADEQNYERLPANVKNRADRIMLAIRSITYEPGEPGS